MFAGRKTHICSIDSVTNTTPKEKLPFCKRLRRWWLDKVSVCVTNPSCLEYYRSESAVLAEKKQQMDRGGLIIHPFSKFRTYYSIYLGIIYSLSVLFIPFSGAFPYFTNMGDYYIIIINTLNAACFGAILMQFACGYIIHNEKRIVMKPLKIAKRYLFSFHFICDLLSSLPQFQYTDYQHYTVAAWTLSCCCILKGNRIPTIIKYSSQTAKYFNVYGYYFKFIRVVLQTYLLLHLFTCLSYLHSLIEYKFHWSENTWIERIIDEDIFTNYVYAMYRSSSYLFAIECDILGSQQIGEHYMACFMYIAGKLYCLYIIVVVLDLYTTRHALEIKYFAVMSQVNCYMQAKKIQPHMRQKIYSFYNYKFNNKYYKAYNLNTFFSEQLRNEINTSIYVKLLREVNILTQLPKDALEHVLSNLKTEVYLPHDIIIRAGTHGDCMFFLASGTVAVYTPTGGEICHLQDGAYFGEIALLCDVKRTATVIAIEICKIYILRGHIFKKCFSTNAELFKNLKIAAALTAKSTEEIDVQYMSRIRVDHLDHF